MITVHRCRLCRRTLPFTFGNIRIVSLRSRAWRAVKQSCLRGDTVPAVPHKFTMQRSRSEVVRTNDGVPATSVEIDCKDSLRWEWELNL
jgi:hypothetical protein